MLVDSAKPKLQEMFSCRLEFIVSCPVVRQLYAIIGFLDDLRVFYSRDGSQSVERIGAYSILRLVADNAIPHESD